VLPVEIPLGTTATALVTEIVPALHAKMVPAGVPGDAFVVAVRIEDEGSWTVRVRGAHMTVSEGEDTGIAPTLWMWTTARTVERFLEDATTEKRLQPKFGPVGGVGTMSDPRVLRRVALASGKIELALVDERGERHGVVFGFGAAAKKEMDPEDVDTVIQSGPRLVTNPSSPSSRYGKGRFVPLDRRTVLRLPTRNRSSSPVLRRCCSRSRRARSSPYREPARACRRPSWRRPRRAHSQGRDTAPGRSRSRT
jgi:hypothetical protein